jgi:hypothetical protein
MDILQYQKDRNSELELFKKDYSDLKVEYNRLLTDAIYEKDPQKQSDLVDQVLKVNGDIATLVREFIANAPGKYDPKTVAELTKDIIDYQKEYADIKNSKKKDRALHNALSTESKKLSSLKNEFNIMLVWLMLGILVVLFLIFRTTSSIPQLLPTSLLPSTSTTGLST